MKRHFYLRLLLLLLCFNGAYGQLPEPNQNLRGLWVTQFKTSVLGISSAEDALIDYALVNDFNYIICTNMYQILTASCGSFTPDMIALQEFVAKAHTAGITSVSGNVGSLTTAEKIQAYNNCGSLSSLQKLDMITYECEFYNDATNGSCPSYDSYISQLTGIKEICESTAGSALDSLVCEAYIGGEGTTGKVHTYSSEAQMEEIASVADHILLTYYRPSPFSSGGNFFNWTIERLKWIAKDGVPSNIVLLFKSRDTDANNMYDYLHTYPGLHYDAVRDPFLSWVEGTAHNISLTKGYREKFIDGTYPWLSGVQLQGFTWFEHLSNMEMIPLPVKLKNFRLVATEDNLVELFWTTLSEVQHDYFEIERSSDATRWNTLRRISGAGSADHVYSYSWLDRNPLSNTSYYRLKQVDYDGAYSYSTLRSVELESQTKAITLLPNPANDWLKIAIEEGVKVEDLEVFHSSGRRVDKAPVFVGPDGVALDISRLAAGMYLLVYKGQSTRFVKAVGAGQD